MSKTKDKAVIVEEVVIMVFFNSSGKLKETRYHIPPGMTGTGFLAFKTRNHKLISKLKEGKGGNNEIIKQKELEYEQANVVLTQYITLQDIPDDIIIQRH